eukprot:scaffold7436_cov83-Attheya_sp.AAC.1
MAGGKRGQDKAKRKKRRELDEDEKKARRNKIQAKTHLKKSNAENKAKRGFLLSMFGNRNKKGSGSTDIEGSDAVSSDEEEESEEESSEEAIGKEDSVDNNPAHDETISDNPSNDKVEDCSKISSSMAEEEEEDDDDSITNYVDAMDGYAGELNTPPVNAELNIEEDVDVDAERDIDAAETENIGGTGNADTTCAPTEGIMGSYVYHIHERLKKETASKFPAFEEKWLLLLLKSKENSWWLRQGKAEIICKKLGIQFDEPSYYRDILVWLPELRWGHASMPCCPGCKRNKKVGFHAYRENHFSRTVIGLKDNYYMISRRYICYDCKEERQALKEKVIMAAAENDIQVEIPKDKRLPATDAVAGKKVDIVPRHGNVACMATRAGWGTILMSRYAESPEGITPAKVRPTNTACIIQVEQVVAPHLVVPGMKTGKGEQACLGDFGKPPFQVVFPLLMMREHVESENIRVLPMNVPDDNDEDANHTLQHQKMQLPIVPLLLQQAISMPRQQILATPLFSPLVATMKTFLLMVMPMT